MNIQGIGILSALGRGIETLESALEHGSIEPSRVDVPFQETPFPVYAVAKETLKDPILRAARRADRFSKMAALAACDAVRQSGAQLDPEKTGMVLGTAFGPHPTVFSFLDDVLEFGDAEVSPTLFSNSVHNAAASYISVALGLRGPATTITSFTNPFRQSLLVAQNWLEQGVCDSILVGSVEACGTVMEYIVSQKLKIATGKMKPFFAESEPEVVPGEGAVCFLLTRDVGDVSLTLDRPPGNKPDLWIVDFECSRLPDSAPAGCWSYLTGSSPLSSAIGCAAGALMIKKKKVYSQTGLLETGEAKPNLIGCLGHHGTPLFLKRQ